MSQAQKRKKAKIYNLSDIEFNEEEVSTVSNLTKRVRKTVTVTVPVQPTIVTKPSASTPLPSDLQLATLSSDLGCINIQTKAKQYENSVSPFLSICVCFSRSLHLRIHP